MTASRSEITRAYFNACVRDLTPECMPGTSQTLYAPVSSDPEITSQCLTQLSAQERKRAGEFSNQADKKVFIQRRAFRRYCAAVALNSSQPLTSFEFVETENGRPYLSGQPQLWFSFSSCRFGFLGARSSTHDIGVDIEDKTRDPGAADLARQYFSTTEARMVETATEPERRQIFFRLWSLKEAALKSIGHGLPFGLDAFVFELGAEPRIVRAPSEFGVPGQYDAGIVESGKYCAAIVIRSRL